MTPQRSLLLLLLLVSALLLAEAAKWRCGIHEDCGQGGLCNKKRGCCEVRGCESPCPPGQTCGKARTGYSKFTRLIDPCTRPKKLGCVWEPENRAPIEWLDLFYDVQ